VLYSCPPAGVDRRWWRGGDGIDEVKEQLRLGAYAILVFGVVLLLASLFADPLAIGTPHSGFGWKQVLGTLVGLAITAGGYLLVRRAER
jgi:hypothetical protein